MADIELVIKIPEEDYERFKKYQNRGHIDGMISVNVIADGTPLPKGHGKLKDINTIYDRIDALNHSDEYKGKYTGVLAILTMTDTIIEADNR